MSSTHLTFTMRKDLGIAKATYDCLKCKQKYSRIQYIVHNEPDNNSLKFVYVMNKKKINEWKIN